MLLGWLGIHLFLVLAISVRETARIFAEAQTFVSTGATHDLGRVADVSSILSGAELDPSNPIRNVALCYQHLAGIESGYGFFAPNIPANYRLVFQFNYPDGHVEYDLPVVASREAGLRLSGLLDLVADADSEDIRKVLLRFLAQAAWMRHRDAATIDAVFGRAVLPTPAEFLSGQRTRYDVLAAYTFSFSRIPPGRDD